MLMAKIKLNNTSIGTFIDKFYDDYIEKYMLGITNDPEISSEAANWAVDADEGDVYIFREGIIEIIEDGSEDIWK